MCVCVCVCVCAVAMGMHMRMPAYVCVHVGSETYLRRNHGFSPACIKQRCHIKRDHPFKNSYHHTFKRLLESRCLFVCLCQPFCVARGPEIRMFTSPYIQKVNQRTVGRGNLPQEVRKRSTQEDETQGIIQRRDTNKSQFSTRRWGYTTRAQIAGTTEMGWENKYRKDGVGTRECKIETDRQTDMQIGWEVFF